MEHKRRCDVLQIFPLFFMVIQCWHDLDNTEYDCWPMEHPDEYNMIDCAGLEMNWVIRPPEKVQSGEEFNVTYSVSASNDFYQMAVTNGILKYSNASEAKRFCEEKECPINWKDATESNCCVYHANIHSCPLAFMKKGGICGPWIPDDGKIVTHTISQAGKMSQQNWTSKVVLIHVGVTSLIAHVKVGHMHAALEAKTTVISGQVCDDGVCDGGERCDTCPADCGVCPMAIGIKVSIGLPIAVFGSGFILTLVWLQYQKQKMLWDESWIINLNEIKLGRGITAAAGSVITVQQASGNSVTSLMTDVTTNTCIASPSHKQRFIQKGIYDGQTVAIKRIPKKTFTLSKTVRKEVKQVRGTLIIRHSIIQISDHPARLQGPDAWLNTVIQHSIIQAFDYPNKILPVRIIEVPLELDHPNLCKFIGGSVEVPNATIITEYCPKGSLADVLFNDDIPLNWGFRLSFATDVARAMAYLHQHRIYHGRLHSMNCVIDDRWVCKVSDYGLAAYRKDDFEEFSPTFNERARRITCAPEVFTGLVSNVTPTSDVYSYSIILLEIATRCEPVSGDIDLDKVEPTWRPYLPEINAGKSNSDCPNQGDYTELIKRCWAHNPLMRPTFEQIKKMLEKMNPNKVSPVDKMMNLMEKYSKHLESIVAERTQDLLQEKQKTDSLLYSMLPKQVADDLRQGITSQAQSYSNATVFFSDIVGFTQLSSASTPYQVVDFLNRLYTCFDAIIDNYDVYKVETIGDAYMVVSGVPKENGIKHASEIASMALDLVAVCSSFIIPHKPDVKLKIRAGIHSGPVVAGVVGTKMPRYCLFGDTVNTASRMESTSEALKIQCSSSSSELLNETGGYILKCRGPLLVKGKGEMTTWWLEGKTCDGTQ